MPIRFGCPNCQTVLSTDTDERAGHEIVCPACKRCMFIPHPIRPPKLGILIDSQGGEVSVPETESPVVVMNWRTDPPPIANSQEVAVATSEEGTPITNVEGADSSDRIRKSIRVSGRVERCGTQRVSFALSLTISSMLVIAIGLLPTNQFTARGIALMVCGGLLAFGSLAVLFFWPRRGRLRQVDAGASGGLAMLRNCMLASIPVVSALIVTFLPQHQATEKKTKVDRSDREDRTVLRANPASDADEKHQKKAASKFENKVKKDWDDEGPKPAKTKQNENAKRGEPGAEKTGGDETEPGPAKKMPRGFKTIDPYNQPPPQPIGLIPEEKPDQRLLGTWRVTWKGTAHEFSKEWTLLDGGVVSSRRLQNGNQMYVVVARWGAAGESLLIRSDSEKFYYRFRFLDDNKLEVTPLGVAPENGQTFPLVFNRVR